MEMVMRMPMLAKFAMQAGAGVAVEVAVAPVLNKVNHVGNLVYCYLEIPRK